MAISFRCPGCGKGYRVADHLAGSTVTCPACKESVTVPRQGEAQAPSQPRAAGAAKPQAPSKPVVREREVRQAPASAPPAGRTPAPYKPRAEAPRLLLSDDAARGVSSLLLLVLLGGVLYLSYRVTSASWLPDELAGRMRIYLAMHVAWSLLMFLVLVVPAMLLSCALACNWTKWELPQSSFLRAAGTATLPYLFLLGLIALAVAKNLPLIIALVVIAPFILIITLKELMGLKWVTTLVAAGLLLVAMPLIALIMWPLGQFMVPQMQKLARIDPDSLQQWAKENPEEFKRAREARFAAGNQSDQSGDAFSAPEVRPLTPAPQRVAAPDPYAGKLEPLIQEIRAAVVDAPKQTREHVSAMHAQYVADFKKFESSNVSPLWSQANHLLTQLSELAAKAPSEFAPTEVLTLIEDRPLPVTKANPAELSKDVFAFKSLRIRPLADSKIDLKGYADREKVQRWSLSSNASVQISLEPLRDPKQQRPWVGDRAIIAHLADRKNLVSAVVEGESQVSYGRFGGIGWTRIARMRGSSFDDVTYYGRTPDAWVKVDLAGSWANAETIAALDKFVQGISLSTSSEPAADPFEPNRVVERFGESFVDPAPVIKAQGTAGVEALRAYVTRMGDNTPMAAKHLLQSIVREQPALAGPVDVKATLATLRTATSTFDKRDALKELARADVDEARRDEVAAELERIVAGDDASFLGEDATAALVKWWRPQTVTALLPLLEEDVWPPSKKTAALKVLPKTGDKRAVYPIVRWIIKEPDEVVPALIEMGPVAEDEVAKLLRERDATVRATAAKILDVIGTSKSVAELRRASMDPRDAAAANVAKAALANVMERVKKSKAATTTPTPNPAPLPARS